MTTVVGVHKSNDDYHRHHDYYYDYNNLQIENREKVSISTKTKLYIQYIPLDYYFLSKLITTFVSDKINLLVIREIDRNLERD